MYVPAHFNEDRVGVMHELIRASGLATLVSMTADGLIASHAPLMLDPEPAPYGTLIGHLAKANPHARLADAGVRTLVIFQGRTGISRHRIMRRRGSMGRSFRPGIMWRSMLTHAGGV